MSDSGFKALMGFFSALALAGGLLWGGKLVMDGQQNAAMSQASASIAQTQELQSEADSATRKANLASLGSESPEAIRMREQADREHEHIVNSILAQAH